MNMHASLAPLERVVAKYRRDVHQLPSGAPDDALAALEGHLGSLLPPGLRDFLAIHNGVDLFRGEFRIRPTASVSEASEISGNAILFADGPGEVQWAFAEESPGRYVFGHWDGEKLACLHTTFAGWFGGTLAVVEARALVDADRDALRRQLDPEDPWQLVRAGGAALRDGRPDDAERQLSQATTLDPENILAWQYLGDALAISDRTSARMAWMRALRRTRLPLPFPGASSVHTEVFRSLAPAFADAENWEKELHRFLSEAIVDVHGAAGAFVLVAAGEALATSLINRGRRAEARDVLTRLVSRSHTFTHAFTPWDVTLHLAALEVGLGHHDEAEALIRRIRAQGPETLHGQALLLQATIVVSRQEPWAEEILADAEQCGLDEVGQVRLNVLRVERMVRQERIDGASERLEFAARLAKRLGMPVLQAQVCLADGDLARIQKDLPRARTAYMRALTLMRDQDAELRWRVELRLGDVCLDENDVAAAEKHFVQAARGFGDAGLPVREAWAMLRLVRLALARRADPTQLIKAARDRFMSADLAIGVAAADAMSGDPGRGLDWHLERATAQARARHDAQASRPPWNRADAERPERRLGAHRLAIAASSEQVVDALAAELDACAQGVAAGHGRAKDPLVLRFVAACDLLSGHRSYKAARVLLHHLLHRTVDGVAYRALQGAVARSPNAAIVDGLLRCVESPDTHLPHAVSAAAELLGLRREPAAAGALVRLMQPNCSPTARKASVVALGRVGNRHVVGAVAEILNQPGLAESAAVSLLMLGDRRGIDFHGRALMEKRKGLSGHPGEIVGRYGGPEHLLLLQNAAEGASDRALGALQGLGLLGDPRGISTLLDGLHARDRNVVDVASGALSIITGHHEDMDTPGWRNRWHAWWETNAESFPGGVRHRDGKRFDCGLLVTKLTDPHAWTRRTAYDELVITSGESLPFDAEGPWRIQLLHVRAWKAWWAKARHRQVAGRWYHDGRQIS
ncbi:MAG: hypothetical protein GWP91_01150 [Rhodobacterales bacterium]|nr:hypothetical protein [Rhodobacterales bacterium]